ncbi:hypothetical protein [Sphingomonas sp.]|jgi:hypothetical protein|uniref:hypothetical protein n=1 Tax=Sphingomonas sp. TaxID=28214 RepID=UPI002EDB6C27
MTTNGKIALAISALWVVPLPIVLLGIGMSGGRAVSPTVMWQNLLSLDPAFLLQLFVWIYLLLPLLAILAVVRNRDRAKGSK